MITLTPDQEQLVESQLATGRYASAEEVLELALQLLVHLEAESQAWLEETRQKIEVGLAELDRGEGIEGAVVMDRFLQKFQDVRQQSQQ